MLELISNLEEHLRELFEVIPGYQLHKDVILNIVFKLKQRCNE